MWFSIVTEPVYIPTRSAQGLPFLCILSYTVTICLFDTSHSNECEVMSCDFNLHLPDDYWGFPGGSEVKASVCNAGDLGSIPG